MFFLAYEKREGFTTSRKIFAAALPHCGSKW
jgi:hypothetical protein